MIQLGLKRAAQLFRNNPQPWKAIHVAGTNGKGTVCTYMSAMLHAAGIRCGRFTSPHLMDRWDCISIDEQPVQESLFREVEQQVLQRNHLEQINATEFEILTATAFDIFTREKIEVGVVEVGMGGAEDATNVLHSKAVTIISKIGLDHQKFLGETIEEITKQKCGIFMKDVPVVYDYTNEPSVIKVMLQEAKRVGTGPVHAKKALPVLGPRIWGKFSSGLKGRRQTRLAIASAYHALNTFIPELKKRERSSLKDQICKAIMQTVVPGRLQMIHLKGLTGIDKLAMVDGAHNSQAAQYLGAVVKSELREQGFGPITWVVACTKGKDIASILQNLLTKGDSVAVVEFGRVDGMPWIEAMPLQEVADAAQKISQVSPKIFGKDIKAALQWAAEETGTNPVVITGSLYLVSDVLRLQRDHQLIERNGQT